MTTFPNRKVARDALAALFVANGTWKAVYAYGMAGSVIADGISPVLIIRSRGTRQEMANLNTNPRSYRLSLQSWILAKSEISGDSWSSDESEDALDLLDMTLCQVIRDNVQNNAWDNIRFATDYSDVVDLNPAVPYIVETRIIYVDLPKGSK